MSTLADYTSRELIVPQLESTDGRGAIAELAELLERAGLVSDARVLVNATIRRELLSSTAVPPGWALPHGRIAECGNSQLCFGLGRSRHPIAWFGAVQPVRLIFLFAVPESAAPVYLTVVSGLARLSQDSVRANHLLEAADEDCLLQVLEQVELRAGRNRAISTTP